MISSYIHAAEMFGCFVSFLLVIAKLASGLKVTTEKLNNLLFEIRVFPPLYSFKTALVISYFYSLSDVH